MENETEMPLGWSHRYKIIADLPNRTKVQQWLKDNRGIAVWVNCDLSGGPLHSKCGHLVFTPGDCGMPHWAYSLVEILPDANRLDAFEYKEQARKPSQSEIREWQYDKADKLWWKEVPVVL